MPKSMKHPISGFTYELTQVNARIYVRYLPRGVSIGSHQPRYLTIGTYPLKNAGASVRGIAKRLRVTPMKLHHGAIAVLDTKHPTSVYLAFPGSDYEIEVYDPSPAFARKIAATGRIRPVRVR